MAKKKINWASVSYASMGIFLLASMLAFGWAVIFYSFIG